MVISHVLSVFNIFTEKLKMSNLRFEFYVISVTFVYEYIFKKNTRSDKFCVFENLKWLESNASLNVLIFYRCIKSRLILKRSVQHVRSIIDV